MQICEWCGIATGDYKSAEEVEINGRKVNVSLKKIDLSHVRDAEGKITLHNVWRVCHYNEEVAGTKSCHQRLSELYERTEREIKGATA